MGSSSSSVAPASSEFLAVFRAHADASGAMPFARFMELALYHAAVGYYRRPRARIGYGPDTDFFTASTSGPLFGELVAAACVQLLGARDPRECTFVELGVESNAGILSGVEHPFGAARTIRLGEPIALAGACVVFSNELFDAQPFHRFVFRSGAWRELGVRLHDGALVETELPAAAESVARLPKETTEGYVIDAPFAAARLAREIAAQSWSGLFVAFDYGKSWLELAGATPAGTARAYHRHTQSNALLAQPGAQDLTCHVCWDWLADALVENRFAPPTLESQEAFFIHHAASLIARIAEVEAAQLSRRKLALMQLLHPAHLGQKFQVLHASRG
jgi:SAM-dependent MidA family methyltransferase